MRGGAKVPHMFVNQLVHVILRNALDDCATRSCCAPPKCSFGRSA